MTLSNKHILFIKNNINGKTSNEMIELFYKKFGISLSYEQLKYIKRKYNLKSNINTKFTKNSITYNKKYIGYEFKDKNGYIWIKIKEPNTFVQKQRYVYEKYNGKIPKNKSIIFLNGNKEDCSIDNLMLVDDCDKLVAKNLKLFSYDKEVTKTGITLAKLINKIYKIKKEVQEEK